MRNLAIIFAFLILTGNSFASGVTYNSVPGNIKEYIHTKFPHASHVEITKAAGGNYEAYIISDSKEVTIELTKEARVLKLESEIDMDQLPAAIVDQFTGNEKIIFASVSKTEDGKQSYIVEVKNNKKTYQYSFEASGLILNKELL